MPFTSFVPNVEIIQVEKGDRIKGNDYDKLDFFLNLNISKLLNDPMTGL